MISPETMFEMMSPTKALEAASRSKLFESGPSRFFQNAAQQMAGILSFYQAQTRKSVDFWLHQSEIAVEEGQKLLKEWADSMEKTNAEFLKSFQAAYEDAAATCVPTESTETRERMELTAPVTKTTRKPGRSAPKTPSGRPSRSG